MSPSLYDAAIVGGGPAGLSAAIWLGRFLHSVVLIDSGDPRNWEARGVHGYLGLPDVPPKDLRGSGRDEARRFGAELVDGCVRSAARLDNKHFRLILDSGQIFESRRLLLAFGIKDEWPDVPGLDKCYGETVHHCPDCDGYEARGCKTVVIASGRKAAGMAFALTTWTRDLVICTNGEPANIEASALAKLDQLNVPVLVDKITRMGAKEGQVRQLELAGGKALDCERIFFALGQYPADDLAVQLGCKRDDQDMIEVDRSQETTILNVYAAGDLVPGPNLAISAAAEGAIAAAAIHRSLMPEVCRF
ncbi:MAG: NAD(P)/FAD-dependent oxidoreductase [Gemmatimonadaceae bacterium]|nr:NAD(P)/FAD-dependent oxidoreductase [Gemmatimonadaceae bacterium]MDQ3518019.1 NAD(P)/FAD-dependent oxidoreductase [Gemmatimonadota bacterium]